MLQTWEICCGCESLEKLNLSSFHCESKDAVEDMFKDCLNLNELECDNEIIINEYNGENKHSKRIDLFHNNLNKYNLLGYHNPLSGLGIGFGNYL